ncbi:MAG TPA: cohesin domain-containing protein [Candidatus Hydrogenedentes bacterium]|nr:cohesin domain-containing protein [Candidatus Hydrogenedentota bacterium]
MAGRIVIALVIAGVGLCGTVTAAVLTAGDAHGDAGDTEVIVAVSLDTATVESVAALQFDLLFNGEVLSLPEVTVGAAAAAAGKDLCHNLIQPGQMRVIIAGFNQNIIGDGVVAEAHFSIAEDAPGSVETLSFSGVTLSDPNGQAVPVTPRDGTLTIGNGGIYYHSADYNPANWQISLAELLRAIQLYNADAYACLSGSEDGYAPGTGSHACTPHTSDYAPQDWIISLSELLRLIQLYNIGAYHMKAGTEDGFEGGP